MTPETIAMVDFDGKQLAGKFKRTSECMTHLAIFRNQPAARATCHAHPVHATAFAVAGVRPPTCMIPEAEVFFRTDWTGRVSNSWFTGKRAGGW
ncbi:MAG: class II aldolase/adducin family protein [Verrucomicrobia bacterium]|nr:class II aldolase/adducin family protein [Verrucomicrobiota bacterium]